MHRFKILRVCSTVMVFLLEHYNSLLVVFSANKFATD